MAMAMTLSAGGMTWATGGLLAIGAVWNVFNSLLALRNRRLGQHRLINVLFDSILSFLLFITAGGLNGPLLWASMLALFSSAIYFEVSGVITTALILSLAQSAITFIQIHPSDPVVLILLSGLNLVVGAILGLSSVQLIQWLRRIYFKQVELRSQDLAQAARQERIRVRDLYQMIETLNATLNYQRVLETALDLGSTALSIDSGAEMKIVSAVLLFQEHNLQVGAYRGLSASDLRMEFPAEKGALATAIKTGETQLVDRPINDPELSMMVALERSGCALLLPLNRGLELVLA